MWLLMLDWKVSQFIKPLVNDGLIGLIGGLVFIIRSTGLDFEDFQLNNWVYLVF